MKRQSKSWRDRWAESTILASAAATCIALVGLVGCSGSQEISPDDAATVLTQASIAAAKSKIIPSSVCAKPELRAETTIVVDPKSPKAWVKAPAGASYRVLKSASIGRLPKAALEAFGPARVRTDCRHTLTFHEAQFVEIRTSLGTQTQAFVDLNDYCPECGAGYRVTFTRSDGVWKMDPPGVVETWVS
ncbi:hypothetical protein OKA06_02040 [Novosphingobium sp. MW5]|nr:hypothetical protein [Novosphingobium sp. MW5]